MRAFPYLLLGTLFACAIEMSPEDGSGGSGSGSGSGAGDPPVLADVQCTGTPAVGPAGSWRHTLSSYIVDLGAPHHRGIDLIASTDDATQTIAGKITYGPTDKDLEDEDVEVFACLQSTW